MEMTVIILDIKRYSTSKSWLFYLKKKYLHSVEGSFKLFLLLVKGSFKLFLLFNVSLQEWTKT